MDGNRNQILCDECSVEVFCDVNMVMIKDKLWEQVCEDNWSAVLCPDCIQRRLGRNITKEDFKSKDIPCNLFWLYEESKLKNAYNKQI